MWYIVLLIVIGAIIGLLLLSLILMCLCGVTQKLSKKNFKSSKKLNGKTILVTGGTAGMGFEIAKELARRDAKLIIACPFSDEGEKAENDIATSTGNKNVTFMRLDLASLQSVRDFANQILNNEDRLDILINNAGVLMPDKRTDDGMNFVFQVNYFGHFLLTLLLLPLLKKSGTEDEPSRIVNVSSMAHRSGKIDFDNINKAGYKFKYKAYFHSKLAVTMFTIELAKRLKAEGCNNVIVNSSDPGVAVTQIVPSSNACMSCLKCLVGPFYPSSEDGAQTTLHVALDEEVGKISGGYFKNCKQIQPARNARDENVSNQLWEESIKIVNLDNSEIQLKPEEIVIVVK